MNGTSNENIMVCVTNNFIQKEHDEKIGTEQPCKFLWNFISQGSLSQDHTSYLKIII